MNIARIRSSKRIKEKEISRIIGWVRSVLISYKMKRRVSIKSDFHILIKRLSTLISHRNKFKWLLEVFYHFYWICNSDFNRLEISGV